MSDKTQFAFIIGMLVLLFGSYFGIMGAIGWLDKKEREKRGEPPRFDERQRIARLRAGNHALCALIAFLVVWTILNQLGYPWAQNIWTMLFCALLLTWGVWAADCVLHDGLIGWKEKKNSSDAFALTYTTTLLMISRPFQSSGVMDSWLPFIFAAADEAVLCAAVLYKYRKEKRAEKEEDVL